MRYEKLGTTDIEVSKICLGTMTFGNQNSEEEAHEQLNYAIEQGINFIDTAELYAIPASPETQGLTEKYIGTWLKDRSDRQDLIVASKITGPSGLTWIREDLRFGRAQLTEALHKSLDRLQTDYIDLYQLHWPERKTNFFGKLGYTHSAKDEWQDNFAEVLGVLEEFMKEGKIRHIGISNETPWGMMHYLEMSAARGLPRVASIQNPYNLVNRSFEVGLAEMSIREKVGLLAYSPMAFGLLSGKYHTGKDKPEDRLNAYGEKLPRYMGKKTHEATGRYLEIAREHGLSLAQMSLAFVTDQPFTTSNIIGATSMDHLKENIASIDVTLSEEVIEAINAVHAEISNPAP